MPEATTTTLLTKLIEVRRNHPQTKHQTKQRTINNTTIDRK